MSVRTVLTGKFGKVQDLLKESFWFGFQEFSTDSPADSDFGFFLHTA